MYSLLRVSLYILRDHTGRTGRVPPFLEIVGQEVEFEEFEPLKICFIVSRFKPVLNCNRFSADLRRGSNSLNSDMFRSVRFVLVKERSFLEICWNLRELSLKYFWNFILIQRVKYMTGQSKCLLPSALE